MSLRTLAAVFAYNEKVKLARTLARFPDERSYDVLVMDDGSTDGSTEGLDRSKFIVLRNEKNRGIGNAMKRVIHYAADEGYDVVVMQAGNDKDRPEEIPRLVEPIEKEGFALVQGSRYLPGGNFGNMPLYRQLATRFLHPWLFSLLSGMRVTDGTNGFRAIKLSLFADERINIDQEWLGKYELEPYIFYLAIRLGYKVREAPVTKIYPPKALGYTKMKPITGWWSLLRPIIYLWAGVKK